MLPSLLFKIACTRTGTVRTACVYHFVRRLEIDTTNELKNVHKIVAAAAGERHLVIAATPYVRDRSLGGGYIWYGVSRGRQVP